jgi:hypothetical protein
MAKTTRVAIMKRRRQHVVPSGGRRALPIHQLVLVAMGVHILTTAIWKRSAKRSQTNRWEFLLTARSRCLVEPVLVESLTAF